MSVLSKFIKDITGQTAVERQNEATRLAGAQTNAQYQGLAGSQEQAYDAQLPWLQKIMDWMLQNQGEKQGIINSQTGRQEASINQTLSDTLAAGRSQDAQREKLVREGMSQDTSTLQGFLKQALASQSPFQAAYQQLLQSSLPLYLGAISGQSQLPVSGMAQTGMSDASRQIQAAMQKQGLGGSSMAMAQNAAARNRILQQDQENQLGRLQQNITTGLGGASLTSGTISPYAQSLGSIGNRLSQVPVFDASQQISAAGNARTNLYGQSTNAMLGSLADLTGILGDMGNMAYARIANPAQTRATGSMAVINANNNAGQNQAPTFLQTLGSIGQLYSQFSGFGGGGGGGQGYFGNSGDWSSRRYAQGFRDPSSISAYR